MVNALSNSVDIFRPSKGEGYNGAVIYQKATLYNIKLAQPTRGWTVDTGGAMRSVTATLYFNVGHSSVVGGLEPIFAVGDMVCDVSGDSEPSEERLVVRSVTVQRFKGSVHHYEVVLA